MANLYYGIPTYKRPDPYPEDPYPEDPYPEDPYDSWDEPVYQHMGQPNYEVEIHLPGTVYEGIREQLNEILERKEADMSKHETLAQIMIEGAYAVDHILRSGDRTIVFWKDGTKTVVKRSRQDCPDDYMAFTAALAIKIYGSNSALKKMLKDKTFIQLEVGRGHKIFKKSDLYAPLEGREE